mmetsp:Transcript_20439/g.62295  ORF Transcript_20439/g.62295 Transcript_20439/m.62295 type:complete len:166 (-) Transcript_20439:81-578(-)
MTVFKWLWSQIKQLGPRHGLGWAKNDMKKQRRKTIRFEFFILTQMARHASPAPGPYEEPPLAAPLRICNAIASVVVQGGQKFHLKNVWVLGEGLHLLTADEVPWRKPAEGSPDPDRILVRKGRFAAIPPRAPQSRIVVPYSKEMRYFASLSHTKTEKKGKGKEYD